MPILMQGTGPDGEAELVPLGSRALATLFPAKPLTPAQLIDAVYGIKPMYKEVQPSYRSIRLDIHRVPTRLRRMIYVKGVRSPVTTTRVDCR